MDSELEVIRDQMHQTRASLADKLDALESQVRETVQTATDAVSTTVDAVKDTVEGVTDTVKSTVEGVTDTVATVADKLDVTQYVERAPWTSVGVAVGVGFAAGYLLGGPSRGDGEPSRWSGEPSRGYGERDRDWGSLAPAAEQKQAQGAPQESFLGSMVPDALQEGFQTALTGLQGLAIGAVMGLVREMVTSSLPGQMQQDINRLVDRVTTQLGGKPMTEGWLNELTGSSPARQEEGQREFTPEGPATAYEGVSPTPKRQERRKVANERR